MRRPLENAALHARSEVHPGVWLDSRRALWLAAERLLVVADLHWGYALAHQARGNLLPSWGDDHIERQLRSLIEDYAPAEMLWLGDIVHAAEGITRAEQFLARAEVPIVLLAGNHDRRWRRASSATERRGCFFFHHGDATPTIPPDCVEIVGHYHPAFALTDGAGARAKFPAFIQGPRRWILPAFSPWSSGTDWNAQRDRATKVWVVAPKRILGVPAAPPPLAAV